jgi:6-phosphogluconolactonase
MRLAIRPCGGQCPRHFAIAPSGRFLLVENQENNEVVVLPVLEALGAPMSRISAMGASCIHFVRA